MKKEIKMNVLLAVTDQLRGSYKRMLTSYSKYFAKSQGAFRGEKRTYTPKDNTIDEPNKRGVTRVQTTVKDKLDYFIETSAPFVDALFSMEKTNSSDIAKAELIVEDKSWGEYSSLELLRLKSLLENNDLGDFNNMLDLIPVRSDSENWVKTSDSNYEGREVYETQLITGIAKTTVKEHYVLKDPNINGNEFPVNYQPAIGSHDKIMELGDYTQQKFSGEWTQREKALTMRRREILLTAITRALKEANACVAQESNLSAKMIFSYIFYGK